MVQLLVLSGLPCSGKTVFTSALTHFFKDWVRVSRDDNSPKSKCVQDAKEALLSGKNVVVDAVNYNEAERNIYVKMALSIYIPVDSLFFDSPCKICKTRVSKRTHHHTGITGSFGVEVVSRIDRVFIKPTTYEGFRFCISMSKFVSMHFDTIVEYDVYNKNCLDKILADIGYPPIPGSVSTICDNSAMNSVKNDSKIFSSSKHNIHQIKVEVDVTENNKPSCNNTDYSRFESFYKSTSIPEERQATKKPCGNRYDCSSTPGACRCIPKHTHSCEAADSGFGKFEETSSNYKDSMNFHHINQQQLHEKKTSNSQNNTSMHFKKFTSTSDKHNSDMGINERINKFSLDSSETKPLFRAFSCSCSNNDKYCANCQAHKNINSEFIKTSTNVRHNTDQYTNRNSGISRNIEQKSKFTFESQFKNNNDSTNWSHPPFTSHFHNNNNASSGLDHTSFNVKFGIDNFKDKLTSNSPFTSSFNSDLDKKFKNFFD
ncbi:Transcription factor [Smittium culicis]|uniref:Transcription factor n=1 Tax=Smittium culicis TaxID=133412 RepID=A0A1R1XE09_9FUNG|nr:Transcription factor [Smittium culicis]